MKKKITILSIIFISLFMINVNAKQVQIYFYPEGGKVTTKDFKIIDDYVTYKDGTNYATYKDTDTIKVLGSIKGKKFTLKKSGTYQVYGKEWYTTNYKTNKYFYLDETQSYKVSTLISKLGLTNEEYPVISLFANWDDEGVQEPTPVEPEKATRITIKANDTDLKVKEKTTLKIIYTPSNAKTEKITWTTSDKKIATVSSTGVVTGVGKGTATITATSARGLKATQKIFVTKSNYVMIRYKTNGGNLIVPHGNNISSKSGYIYNRGDINASKLAYGESLPKTSGLANYNNPKCINIQRSGYTVPKGAEWNTKANGTGKSYSQTSIYSSNDFCNASKKDCIVTLYVNWKKVAQPTGKKLNVKFDCNGGTGGGTQTFIENKKNQKFSTKCAKKGYTLVGWNEMPDGTGAAYSATSNVSANWINKNSPSKTLYARYKENIDVVLMFGQSNMVGSTSNIYDRLAGTKDTRQQNAALYNSPNNPYDDDILKNYVNIGKVKYSIPENVAFEYKYETNSLIDIYNGGGNLDNFGEVLYAKQNKDNRTSSRSAGTNIVPYFAKAYTKETGHKLVVVHFANGGKAIECFLPQTDKEYRCNGSYNPYIYENLVSKYKAALTALDKKGYKVENSFYVVFQGEANASTNSKYGYKNYYNRYLRVHNNFKKALGLKFGAIIYTSNRPSVRSDKNRCKDIDGLHAVQAQLISKNKDIMLGSDWGYRRYTEKYEPAFGFKAHTVVYNGTSYQIDENTIHFNSAALSKIGVDTAINVSKRIKNPNMNTSYTGYTKKC